MYDGVFCICPYPPPPQVLVRYHEPWMGMLQHGSVYGGVVILLIILSMSVPFTLLVLRYELDMERDKV